MWDKDDEEAMDFVAACSNIRSKIFGISQKTRFDIKSMAGNNLINAWKLRRIRSALFLLRVSLTSSVFLGNIIPAIATTNAVIAGCIVMEALKILNGQIERCKTVSKIYLANELDFFETSSDEKIIHVKQNIF